MLRPATSSTIAARLTPKGSRGQAVLAAAAYVGFALAITWPFAVAPGDTLFGGVGSDLTAAVTHFRELADAGQPPFLAGHMADLDAPEGLTTQWSLDLASFPSSTLLWLSAEAFGGIAGYGLLPVVNFAGSAFAMFLLIRWLTGSAGAGFVAGVAFGFWPFAFSAANVPFGSGWVLVILVWRMLVVLREPSVRNGLLAGAAAVLALAWTPYWLLIGGVLYAVLVVYALVAARSRSQGGRQLKAQALAAAVVLGWLAAVWIVGSSNSFTDVPIRSSEDSVRYSARPLMYLVPGPQHPLLGDATTDFLGDRYFHPDSAAAYTPIYLGIVTLVLALAGLVAVFWPRIRKRAGPPHATEIALLGIALVLVAGLFSGPPEVQILGATIKTPVDLVSRVTTSFRAVARFAEVVMLGLCLLVGLGVAALLRHRSPTAKVVLVVALSTLLAVDLWNREPPGPTRVEYPAVLTRLAERPAGVVAEYPILAAVNSGSDTIFYQQAHGHPLLNGFRRDTETESYKVELQALQDTQTVHELARIGVRYVLVRQLGIPSPGVPDAGAQIPGLRLVDRDSYGALYEIVARPARIAVHATKGFSIPEGDPVRFIRWMSASTATLKVRAPCAPCDGTLVFTSGTHAVPRRLTVSDETGRVRARVTISSAGQPVRVPVRIERTGVVKLHIDPPPQAPSELDPRNPDTRPLGVFIGFPIRFVRG